MYTTLILDLGDVLFHWSPVTQTAVSAKNLKKMISSTIWSEYERGYFSEERCCEKLGHAFNNSVGEIRKAMEVVRSSFRLDQSMYSAVCDLKRACNLQVIVMSNMSVPDYALVRTLFPDQTVFDEVFISGVIGMRKPDERFFNHVLEKIHTLPQRAIFVDDKLANVTSAQSLGIKALVCQNTPDTIHELWTILDHSAKLRKQIIYTAPKGFSSTVAEVKSFDDDWSLVRILDMDQDTYDDNVLDSTLEYHLAISSEDLPLQDSLLEA
ncbi:hypothetical protein MMC17_009032 [Xylographa soralifera]|nr:hypothetical protein [Xylographa soralifera]